MRILTLFLLSLTAFAQTHRIPIGTAKRVLLKAYLESDHISAATGKTIAVTISKNGAAFGNPSAGATNATEIASGWYYVDLSTTDTGTAGPLAVRGTNADIDDTEIAFEVGLGVFIKKNTALSGFTFPMRSTADYTPSTGRSVTCVRSIDGGATASCTNAVSEVGSGLYKVDLAAADTNGSLITLILTASGAHSEIISLVTQP
jgi:hypothetical protein